MIDVPDSPTPPAGPEPADGPDLDVVERDLNDVEAALGRLDEGSYWTDEVTGEELADDVLAEHPAARRS